MTTETIVTEETAHQALLQLEKIERAIDRAMQPVADSLEAKDRAGVDKRIRALKDTIKFYLEESGGLPLHDGEFDTTARLQARAAQASYDLETCMKTAAGPDAIHEAGRRGMLRVDDKMLGDYRKRTPGAAWADALWKSRTQHGATNALLIDRGNK